MQSSDFRYIVFIPIISFSFFLIHGFLLSFLTINVASFYYQNINLYSTFTISSIVIVGILIVIKSKNLDIVGMCFLVLTSIKMVVCYVLVRPILALSPEEISVQKMNFFGIFILFLAIETIITIRILNNK